MKQIPQYFFLLCGLLAITAGNGCAPIHDASLSSTPAGMMLSVDPQLNSQATGILSSRCLGCHGASGSGGVSNITDVNHLIDAGLITPGNASQGRIIGSIIGGTMPPGGNFPTTELTTLQNWINSMAWVPEGSGGGIQSPPPVVLEAKFSNIHTNILTPKCIPCHRAGGTEPGINYETFTLTRQTGKVTPGLPLSSAMYTECTSGKMPEAPYSALTTEELKVIYDWITAGALNN